jgi:hypothetical protein
MLRSHRPQRVPIVTGQTCTRECLAEYHLSGPKSERVTRSLMRPRICAGQKGLKTTELLNNRRRREITEALEASRRLSITELRFNAVVCMCSSGFNTNTFCISLAVFKRLCVSYYLRIIGYCCLNGIKRLVLVIERQCHL